MPKPNLERAMAEAEAKLAELGLVPERPARTQLKVGAVSYYPSTGTVFVDGEDGRRSGAGLGVLEAILRELGELPANGGDTAAHPADRRMPTIHLVGVPGGKAR